MPKTKNPLAAIAIDGKEFGEAYHVAAALALDSSLNVCVFRPDRYSALPFLSLFGGNRVNPADAKPGYRNVVESTDIYLAKWHSETIADRLEKALAAVESRTAEVQAFLQQRQLRRDASPAALIWIRDRKLETGVPSGRNSTEASVLQLIQVVEEQRLRPIFIGDALRTFQPGAGNLIRFHAESTFQNQDLIALHLLMFRSLIKDYGVRVLIGMKSGAIDGAGLFMGLPTISFTPSREPRNWERVEKIARKITNFHVIRLDPYNKRFRKHTTRELQELRQLLREERAGRSDPSNTLSGHR